ncbi:MAG TPA: TetR/AcrR family transcriptional regulator [Enhygromyxa sp.]|nr:TetR/AcrR family transcriptional regulator [Enhygromyxa sp.]
MPRAKAFDPEAALDRAVELFWRFGYEGTSMAKLLEFMGISRQSLYDTYGDKHSLFLAAVDRYRANVQRQLAALISGEATAIAGVRAVFEWVNQAVVEHPEHRSCLMANTALELGQRDPDARERVSAHLRDVEGVFAAALERGQRAGELDASRDVRALARFLTGSIHGLGILARGGAPTPVLRDTITTTLAVLDGRA